MKKALLLFALVCLLLTTAHAQTNPPAGSNLALVPACSWTNTTGTLTTTGIADTIGGTNAGRLSNSSSQGTTYVIHSLSQTVAVGDVFMAGVWTRLNSGSTGTGFPGTITLASCTNYSCVYRVFIDSRTSGSFHYFHISMDKRCRESCFCKWQSVFCFIQPFISRVRRRRFLCSRFLLHPRWNHAGQSNPHAIAEPSKL